MNSSLNFDKIFFNFALHAIYFIPFALVTGPFLSDLFLSFVALFFIYISIKNKLSNYYKKWYVYVFFLYYIYLVINSLFSVAPITSLESSLFYFRYIFFVLGMTYIINNKKNFIYEFSVYLNITLLIVLIYGYLLIFIDSEMFSELFRSSSSFRFSGVFGNEYVLGKYLTYMFPIFFIFLSLRENVSKSYLFFSMIMFILIDMMVYLSGERTAFFLLIQSSIIIILLITRFRLIRVTTFIISALIIFTVTYSAPSVKKRMIDDTLSQIGINEETQYIFSKQHQSHYSAAIKMFIEKPLIGHGPKMFRIVCNQFDENSFESKHGNKLACSTHPHNFYIQLLSETGIIGAIPLILSLIYCIFIFIRQAITKIRSSLTVHMNDYEVCTWAAIAVTLSPLVPSMNFFNNWISILVFLPIPFLLSKKENLLIGKSNDSWMKTLFLFDKSYNK